MKFFLLNDYMIITIELIILFYMLYMSKQIRNSMKDLKDSVEVYKRDNDIVNERIIEIIDKSIG